MITYPDSHLNIIRDHLIDHVLSVPTQRSLCQYLPEVLHQAIEGGRHPVVVSIDGFKDDLEIIFAEYQIGEEDINDDVLIINEYLPEANGLFSSLPHYSDSHTALYGDTGAA